jgi:hypothetical protein
METMFLGIMSINMLMTEEPSKDEILALTVSEMVDHICSQVDQLDVPRRYMFMQWLQMHSHAVRSSREIQANLTAWLGSMPAESAAWEYTLIVGETNWWRDLDERRLARLMLENLGQAL